jgi:hypothetical protein
VTSRLASWCSRSLDFAPAAKAACFVCHRRVLSV